VAREEWVNGDPAKSFPMRAMPRFPREGLAALIRDGSSEGLADVA